MADHDIEQINTGIWDKFQNDFEKQTRELKEQNAKRLKAEQEKVEELTQNLIYAAKECEQKIAGIEREHAELIKDTTDRYEKKIDGVVKAHADRMRNTINRYEQKIEAVEKKHAEKMREMTEKHKAQIKSLKFRVRSTLNESDEQNAELDLEGESEDEYTGAGIGLYGRGGGTDRSTNFKGDVTAEGDIFAGNKYAVKSNAEGDTSGISELLDKFGSSSQITNSSSTSNSSEVKVKLDSGGTMTGCENVIIDHKSIQINIGSNNDDDETDYVKLQEKDFRRRVQRWEKRSTLEEATAFAGPNRRIIELVFEDQKEEYFDYLIQDVLPKLDEAQLQEISSCIQKYSIVDLTQRNYDYRYLLVFFNCSPRAEFDKLLMRGRYVESRDIRNLVKALDTRKCSTSIKFIDLSYCKFEATALIELECLLPYSPHVILNGLTESTVVYANKEMKFSVENATQLAKTIAKQERLCVGLSHCSMTFQLMTAFAPMMSKLTMLTLRFCNFDEQAVARLVEGIELKRHLRILDLCDTKLEESSFAHISQCMGGLHSLYLSSVMLKDGGIDSLLRGLSLVGERGMDCLDISFNPFNRDSITRLVDASQDKIKAVLFSQEQIQSSGHREDLSSFLGISEWSSENAKNDIMKMVKRDGNLLTAHSPDHDLGEGSTSRWYLPSKQQTNEVEAGCRIDSNTSQKLGHGEIADQQEVIATPSKGQYCFWTLLRQDQIPNETKRYIKSISDGDIQRRTIQNTLYQCYQCGTRVAFFCDKVDLLEADHFLRDRKFFGLHQNSHCIIVTQAEDDNNQSNKSSSVMGKFIGSKHACNLQCSVNGMNIRTYRCRSCGESLGLYYYYAPPRVNQLNAMWCLLQEDPASLKVGATSRLARNIKKKITG